MERVLRIDLGKRGFAFSDAEGPFSELAGRGLTSFVVSSEVPPVAVPLGPKNKLVFSVGYLAGTAASSSGRVSVGGKSPLTGTIKESNVGGTAGRNLARLGIKAIILEGQSEDWVYLVIGKDKVEFIPAGKFLGSGNYDFSKAMFELYGRDVSVISIGPAGEMMLPASSIAFTDVDGNPSRHAGRGGLGAVMGSKKVKGIVVMREGEGEVKVANPDGFKDASLKFSELLRKHEVTGNLLRNLGTSVLVQAVNDAGALPTKNFRYGKFEGVSKVNADALIKMINERGGKQVHPCMPGCVIGCSNVFNGKDGSYLTSGLEYETIWANGPNLLIDDLDTIAEIDRLCDDLGLDTIETGDALAMFMEAGEIEWGDGAKVLETLREVYKGSAIGRMVGSGALNCAKILGVSRVPCVKGQGLPAYDPRACKGIGVTYATSTMGADHTAGYVVAPSILKVGGDVDPLSREGQVDLSRNFQIVTAFYDCTGLCVFTSLSVLDLPEGMEVLSKLLSFKTGRAFNQDAMMALGSKVISMELNFNRRAGFTEADDRLPEFFYEEKFPPHGTVFDVNQEEIESIFKDL